MLPFDHVSAPHSPPVAIFYANIYSSSFQPLYNHLKSSNTPFVLRWQPTAASSNAKPLALYGYGAALDIKKSDYLAIDDRQKDASVVEAVKADGQEQHQERDPSMTELWDQPASAPHNLKPLTRLELLGESLLEYWQGFTDRGSVATYAGLGEKAAHFILSNDTQDPMSALIKLSQDFPKYAAALSADALSPQDPVLQELQANREIYDSGTNAVWLNGLALSAKQMDPFALLKLMREEQNRVQKLESLGLTMSQAADVLSHPAMSNTMSTSSAIPGTLASLGLLFDASDRQEDGKAILWWNDLETDRRYLRWPSSLSAVRFQAFVVGEQRCPS